MYRPRANAPHDPPRFQTDNSNRLRGPCPRRHHRLAIPRPATRSMPPWSGPIAGPGDCPNRSRKDSLLIQRNPRWTRQAVAGWLIRPLISILTAVAHHSSYDTSDESTARIASIEGIGDDTTCHPMQAPSRWDRRDRFPSQPHPSPL